MSTFRMVHTEFWNDPTVIEEMTPEDKYFFLYLLTNPNTTQIGIYQITKKQMAFDMGYSMETINSLLDRFLSHHKVIRYNEKTREIAIKNWGKYNFKRGGKPVEDLVRKELLGVKDQSLIGYIKNGISNNRIKDLFEEAAKSDEVYFEPSKIYKPKPGEKISTNNYVLWRDKQTCFYTGIVLQKKDVNIDHVTPRSFGGSDTPSNLVVSYSKFNRFKSGSDDIESVASSWNEKFPSMPVDIEEVKRKLFELSEFENSRQEHEITYREAINNNIYDSYSLFKYLNTTRGQYKEQEEDKEEDKEQQEEKEVVSRIMSFWDDNGFGLNNINAKQQLLSWLDDSQFKQPGEIILKAMGIACANNKRRLNYVEGILRNWENESLLTISEIEESENNAKRVHEHRAGHGGGYGASTSYEQAMRELEASKRAVGR